MIRNSIHPKFFDMVSPSWEFPRKPADSITTDELAGRILSQIGWMARHIDGYIPVCNRTWKDHTFSILGCPSLRGSRLLRNSRFTLAGGVKRTSVAAQRRKNSAQRRKPL